jgi:hypothetical protein
MTFNQQSDDPDTKTSGNTEQMHIRDFLWQYRARGPKASQAFALRLDLISCPSAEEIKASFFREIGNNFRKQTSKRARRPIYIITDGVLPHPGTMHDNAQNSLNLISRLLGAMTPPDCGICVLVTH